MAKQPRKTKGTARTAPLDLYKLHRDQYAATGKPALIDVPPIPYLAVDGRGEPGSDAFAAAVGGLYGAAFTLKMTRKFSGRQDYKVCRLEGLWWAGDESADFLAAPRDQWQWALLIRVPDFIAPADLDQAKAALRARKKPPAFEQVRLEVLDEGRCVQVLHVGPYADEPASIEAMRRFAAAQGLAFRGRHHEIYLSDPRRVPPERLRTILRMPVRPAEPD